MKRPKLCPMKVAKCEDHRQREAIPFYHKSGVRLACGLGTTGLPEIQSWTSVNMNAP